MRTRKVCRILAMILILTLAIGVFPVLDAKADAPKVEVPTIKVKLLKNGKDAKVTIGKTKDVDGYEIWMTTDAAYKDYDITYLKLYLGEGDDSVKVFDDYVKAADVKKDGNKKRVITLKNLPKGKLSIKARAYKKISEEDEYGSYDYTLFGDFSKSRHVSVKKGKKGYKTSYDFSKKEKGDTVEFGSYIQDYPINGKKPIEWIVLEKTKDELFVVSKHALDGVVFNNEWADVKWEDCTLRKWLNEVFFDVAFNKAEQGMIKPVKLDGLDSSDRVFLLSYDDMINKAYGFSKKDWDYDINRRCSATPFLEAQGVGHAGDEDLTKEGQMACHFWTRSSGESQNDYYWAYFVHAGGASYAGVPITTGGVGVRPAMRIRIKG